MYLAIDIGNTNTKFFLFSDEKLIEKGNFPNERKIKAIEKVCTSYKIGAIIYSVPTVEELYPEEDNEEILAKYKNIRDAVIYEELQKYGLVTKKERVQQLTDIELMDLGVNYPDDKEVQAQIEALNLQ